MSRRVIIRGPSSGPCDTQKKGALFKGLDVMPQALVQNEQASSRQVEGPSFRSHLNVAGNGMNRDAPIGLMFRKTCVRFERSQDDPEVTVLHKGLGVLTTAPGGFAVKLIQLSR